MGPLRALAVVACGAITLGSCAGDSGDGASPTTKAPATVEASTGGTDGTSTTAAPASTTTTTALVPRGLEAEVLAAHKGFWDTWLAANDPPDPNHPGLRRYYTGAAYEQAVKAITENQQSGLVVRLPTNPRWVHRIIGFRVLSDSSWLIQDCAHDDSIRSNPSTGEVIDDRAMTFLMEATVALHEDTWKVSLNTISREWEGLINCVTEEPM